MLLALASIFTLFTCAARAAFTFTTNQPTQCQSLDLTWSGGQPPFSATVYPAFGSPVIYSIPNSAFSNGNGSFSTEFPFNPSTRNIAVLMSDATGFATGGISPVISIGKDSGSCENLNPSPPFTWDSGNAFSQCRPYQLQIDATAAFFPVTVTVLVPGGTYQNFTANQSTFSIPILDVAAGTEVLLTLIDSRQRTGGNSDITPVLQSGDSSCLTGTFPSSTFVPPSTIASSATSSPTESSSSASSLSGGTIAALIVAAIVVVGAIISLVMFYRKRRQETSRYGRGPRQHVDLDSPALRPVNPGYVPDPYMLAAPSPYELEPYGPSPNSSTVFVDAAGAPVSYHESSRYTQSQSQYVPSHHTAERRQSTGTTMASSAAPPNRNSKAAMREQVARRYVLHTDAADELEEPEGEEVIELPPQYTENRRPIPGLQPYEPSSPSASDSERPR